MSFRDRGNRVLLPFGLEYSDIIQEQDKGLIYPLPINGPVTKLEDDSSKQFTNFTELMKNGNFYSGKLESLLPDYTNSKISYLEGGVNDGIKRYSDRYRKQSKAGRSIQDHPFNLEFFPQELHSVMISKNNNKNKKKKILALSNYSKGVDNDMSEFIKLSEEEKKKELLDRINNVEEDDNENAVNENPEDEEDEDEDEEFEEDEDDDYNAEKYFDDGDDYGDEEDGGDDEAAF
ncbi:nucleotidyltransferase activity protein [[Candida] boidinii]|nr:nucleotidyltransferase activity protein [[Candida] boidinii]OWB80808.1 nucleotidyltransferase activity protein [[Candida] boidinii]